MPRQGVEVDNPADEQAEWRSSCTLTTADAAELVSAQMTTGYSGKQLVEKLGIKSWDRVKTRNAPANYLKLLGPLPKDVQLSARLRRPVDVVHIFSIARTNLQAELRGAIEDIEQDGAIWVSWPKKSSRRADGSDRRRDPRSGAAARPRRRQSRRRRRDLVGAETRYPEVTSEKLN